MQEEFRYGDLVARLNAAMHSSGTRPASGEPTEGTRPSPPFMSCPKCRHQWKPKNPAKPPKQCPVCGSTRAKLCDGTENGENGESTEI